MARQPHIGHFTPERILSRSDRLGEKPEIYATCSPERGPGKTYGWCDVLMNDFEATGHQFALLCRYKQELGTVASGVMNEYMRSARPSQSISEVKVSKNYSEIWLSEGVDEDASKTLCGFVFPIASVDPIKRMSSTFSNVWHMFFDEFMPKDNRSYLKHEIEWLLDIHDSIALRGTVNGQPRRVPLYMASNCIDLYNPYFVAWGLTGQLQPDTVEWSGNGIVYEKVVVEGLAERNANTKFKQAWKGGTNSTGTDNSWTLSDKTCIGKPDGWGESVYMATLFNETEKYAVRYYPEVGYVYIDRNVDLSHPKKVNMSTDGNLNIPMIRNSYVFEHIRNHLRIGQLRMKDYRIKQLVIDCFA